MYLLFNMLSRDDRGWDGWMTSPTQWTWAWVNCGSWWWIGRPGVLHFMRSQRVGHDWVTALIWTRLKKGMTNHFSILASRTPWTVWKDKKIYDIERWTPGSVQFSSDTLEGAKHATGDQWRNNSRKNEDPDPKQKQHPAVDVTGDRGKVQCCKEQYCTGTWNVRPMNQGKLEVVKQEMARVNIDILGISEPKWTGKGEFNSDDHYIYYCGQESLRRNGVAIMVIKRVQNAVLGCNLKNDRTISIHFQGKPFNIMLIQIYARSVTLKKLKLNSSVKTFKTFWN